MNKSLWAVIGVFSLAACATRETPKPPPQPEPVQAPAPAPQAAPAPAEAPPPQAPVKPVAERARIAAEVLFDFDRATLKPAGRSVLDDVVSKSRDVTLESVIVTGHADRIGSEAYNLRLSTRRAEAVKAYLAANGFDAGRIYAEGKGESQPVTGDKCRNMGRENRHNKKLIACLQPDRRVELEVIGTRSR